MTAAAILGAGKVRLNYYDPILGAYQGFGDPLDADKYEITPDSENKQKTGKSKENYGQVIAAVAFAKPTKIAITLSALSEQAMAMQMQGTLSAWTQAAATLTDEVLVAKLDKWVKLSKRNISATGLTVKHTSGTPTYVLGTDYLINYFTGEIKALSTGEITADESLKVSGTAVAIAGTQISAGTKAQIRCGVKWEGVNMVDGQEIEDECWEAVLTSGKGFDFLANDFTGIELTGYLVVPAGKTEPHVIRMKNLG